MHFSKNCFHINQKSQWVSHAVIFIFKVEMMAYWAYCEKFLISCLWTGSTLLFLRNNQSLEKKLKGGMLWAYACKFLWETVLLMTNFISIKLSTNHIGSNSTPTQSRTRLNTNKSILSNINQAVALVLMAWLQGASWSCSLWCKMSLQMKKVTDAAKKWMAVTMVCCSKSDWSIDWALFPLKR